MKFAVDLIRPPPYNGVSIAAPTRRFYETGFDLHGKYKFCQKNGSQDFRRVEEAIASGSKDDATSALRAAQPLIAKAGRKGLVHKRAASRKVSRLAKRVAAIS